MMAALDTIQRLFNAKSTPVAVARNVGLDLVQWLTPVKVSCAFARVTSLLFEPSFGRHAGLVSLLLLVSLHSPVHNDSYVEDILSWK
jgi:hypothetical protein